MISIDSGIRLQAGCVFVISKWLNIHFCVHRKSITLKTIWAEVLFQKRTIICRLVLSSEEVYCWTSMGNWPFVVSKLCLARRKKKVCGTFKTFSRIFSFRLLSSTKMVLWRTMPKRQKWKKNSFTSKKNVWFVILTVVLCNRLKSRYQCDTIVNLKYEDEKIVDFL